jgi:hypothetical protein
MNQRWSPMALQGEAAATPSAGGNETGVDPYFRWARATLWRGYARVSGWGSAPEAVPVQILARAPNQEVLRQVLDPKAGHPLQVPDLYRQGNALHFTAVLGREAERWLLANPLGLTWKLCLPKRDAERVAEASELGNYGKTRDPESLRAANLVAEALKGLGPVDVPPPAPALLGLIDSGCPFLNRAFDDHLAGSGTRLRMLWDQGASPDRGREPRPWRAPSGSPHGRQLGPLALSALHAASRDPDGVDETQVYRSIDHLLDYRDPRRRVFGATHGGHLMDLLAGWPDPLKGQADLVPEPADTADIGFVQLPFEAASDSTGASLAPHLLDGLRYLMAHCATSGPLVVSVSYGGQAGPHDGSSLIETAMDELLTSVRPNNFAIVLAAGNARQARAHATRRVRRNRSALLRVQVAPGDTTDTHVELWYAAPASPLGLSVRVRTPDGQWSPWVAAASGAGREARLTDDASGEVVALLRHDLRVPNGADALALLSLVPTRKPEDVVAPAAQAGEWQIEVRLDGPHSATEPEPVVELRAWIERDDPARGNPAQAPHFVGQLLDDDRDTMCSIATGQHTIAVGGFVRGSEQPAAYSAPGRSPRQVQVLAACEDPGPLPGLRAAATRTGETVRAGGTSVAAPVLARRLFNWLIWTGEDLPNATIREQALALGEAGDPDLRSAPAA